MNKLKIGFSKVNITPMLGIEISGYFKTRLADGVLDELEINAMALECGDKKAVIMCADLCGIKQVLIKELKALITEATGLPAEAIFISATHTHTGPVVLPDSENELVQEYLKTLRHKAVDAAVLALADLNPAKMGFGVGQAPNVAFVRRFRMKDGSVQTNPGVNNPNIDHPIGDVDERVNVLRFDRECGDTVVLVNFGDHPDVVGGNKISADWPRFVRETVEKSLDNTKCIFLNGAQGDVNHVNVHPTGGYLNDLFMDFDDVARGYNHSRYIGRVVAGGVLQAFDKVKYSDIEEIKCIERPIHVPSNMAEPKDLPEAHRIADLHNAGKDSELPYQGMMLTTVVAEALRMVRLENGPEAFDMGLEGIAIGPVALVGIPGEPFTGIGRGIKDTEGFELILPVCAANGYEGYYPMKDAYDEGGYEARSSNFKSGVAEYLIEEGKALVKDLSK
ncbi:MAG: hypothetical protein IJ454_02625 [Clostridia bacterium]|nr:hypothetical protein [Clostridia bacterium]